MEIIMSFEDFRNQNILGKIGRILELTIGRTPTRILNQYLYDIVGNDFTGWSNREAPDFNKINLIKQYAMDYPQCTTFIETGTYFGNTTLALSDTFKHLHTIEVDPWLFRKAKTKFLKYPQCTCHYGDSSKILPALLDTIDEPILYWLDAHYSGGITSHGDAEIPILMELEAICKHKHIKTSAILIDDARVLDINAISKIVVKNDGLRMVIKDDIIRIT